MTTTPPLKRLRLGLLTLGIIFVIAVYGYWWSGRDLLDSVYLVVITLSSVGYGEDSQLPDGLKVFTILLIVFGVSTALYIMGGFVQMMAEGEIKRALGLRRVTREIERLSQHIIVCGFGRMGEILAAELSHRNEPMVIVDVDHERIAEALSLGYLALTDDATDEEALLQAGVKQAKTVVVTLPNDAENVFITLTARNLNRNLQIIARAAQQSTEKKLIQAGANRVVLPAATGAMRMAAMITRPSTVELIELVAGRHVAEVVVDEIHIPQESPLVGITVRESQTRSRHGVLIVAMRCPGNSLEFNPGGEAVFRESSDVVVMGRQEDIDRFRGEYQL